MALCAVLLGTGAFAQIRMTDQQVLDYIQQGLAAGKSQETMAQELALRGVDRAQAERVRALYESQKQGAQGATFMLADERNHTVNGQVDTQPDKQGTLADEVPLTALSATEQQEAEKKVYGRDVFRSGKLNFAPGENLATPRNYRLGPGDEVIVEIYGASQQTIRQVISPEGSISVEYLGPVYLNGLTVDEAHETLRKKLSAIYSGINYGGQTRIQLSLGRVRSIGITVVGDVQSPGSYTVSPFATVFHALYLAGGIVEPGTLRNITVSRGGKLVGTADVYDLLVNGSSEGNLRLEEGDVILVAPYRNMVKLEGMVKRPMYFEMKDGETLSRLIEYAGGFANGAYTENVSVIRQNGTNFEVRTVEAKDFSRFLVQDGDEVTVNQLQSRFDNRLAVFGAVYFPGQYELGDIRTVRQLVAKAGGLLPEAFLGRAVINREHDDRSLEVISINLGRVMAGEDPDLVLRNNDELYVSSEREMFDAGTMSISGHVVRPGTFPYAANTTVEDLIVMAGGLQPGASMARVDVTRHITDDSITEAPRTVGELFTFSIKDGLIADGAGGFVLEPYDEVLVHRSPAYNNAMYYEVAGEVNFPGTFLMTNREERLSDAIRKAGGTSLTAYLNGARLIRTMNKSERMRAKDASYALNHLGDSSVVDLDVLELESTYQVAIDLGKALANPGGPEDIVLRHEDQIIVPIYNNTVRVSGAVNAPGVFSYVPGKRAGDYIERSGGYGDRPYRSRAYVISLNGNKRRMTAFTKIQPGDEIVVPRKERRETDRSAIMAYGSAAASVTTMTMAIVSIINMTNRNSSK